MELLADFLSLGTGSVSTNHFCIRLWIFLKLSILLLNILEYNVVYVVDCWDT